MPERHEEQVMNETRRKRTDGTRQPKAPWQPMRLTYLGDIAKLVQGGGGKLSLAGGDPGDYRKPPGHE
jgi:hypothetical protein